MPTDWRIADSYNYLDNLDPAAIAWEFLRRNSDYRANYRFIMAGVAALFTHRWSCVVDPNLRADHPSIAGLLTTEQL
jgi:hypothetical protein